MFTTIWKTQTIRKHPRALISGFLANARGNVAVITALSALPIVSAIGCAVDYSMATTIKTKLQAAADAATLAAVSANSGLSNAVDRRLGFAKLELNRSRPLSEFGYGHSAEQRHQH
jgi:Flp pilus assembly protein TadG